VARSLAEREVRNARERKRERERGREELTKLRESSQGSIWGREKKRKDKAGHKSITRWLSQVCLRSVYNAKAG